jgi:hypothetical protein
MASVSCPHCGQVDLVQKVSSVTANGTVIGTISGTVPTEREGRTIYVPTYQQTSMTTELVRRLWAPSAPAMRSTGYEAWLIGFLFLASFGSFSFIGIMNTTPGVNTGASLWYCLLPGVVCLFLGIGCTVLYNRSTAKAARYAISQENLLNQARYSNALSRYNQLYYCYRDDCVFIPGEDRAVSVGDMNSLLYS